MVNNLYSQSLSSADWEDLLEQTLVSDEESGVNNENRIDDLMEIARHPLNLNTITKEQLEQFPFLTDEQIENMLYYFYITGSMKTIYELQLVEEMDRQTIQLLLPFVYVAEVEKRPTLPLLKDIGKYGKQELLTRFDIPLYRRSGYKQHLDKKGEIDPSKSYEGSSLYHSLRYSFRYKNQVYFGVTAEKDAGEPFMNRNNPSGYDHYSFYFLVQKMMNLKSLAVGNYRLGFGHGLVMNMDYSMGKTSSISTLTSRTNGIRKHSSTDEYNYLRGVAATYQCNKIDITGFYSHRDMDGNVADGVITSIRKEGLHRLPLEYEKRNKVTLQTTGANLSYSFSNLKLGLTGIYYFFNHSFQPILKPYSFYRQRGIQFYNTGINYSYRWRKFYLSGETALARSGGMATLNTLRFTPLSGYQFFVLQRYYNKRYGSLYASSVSEGTEVQNENGYYLGIEAAPLAKWKFHISGDLFYFPWLKYGVDKPSSGFDGLAQVTYSPQRNLSMFARYQYKVKDKNYKETDKAETKVCPYIQQKFRYQLGYVLDERFSFRSTMDLIWVNPEGVSPSCGFLLNQQFSYNFVEMPCRVDMSYGFFDTDDYASRVSCYEKGLLNVFSVPSFYGKGARFACSVRYDFSKRLTTILKYGQTRYVDREEIGSGRDLIIGNKKTDLSLQVRWKL